MMEQIPRTHKLLTSQSNQNKILAKQAIQMNSKNTKSNNITNFLKEIKLHTKI